MSVRKLTFGLLAAAALLAGQRGAGAQEHLPVADPFHFDPDFRWFEPVYEADLLDMKASKRASTGWFGAYDRMHLYFSRPDVDILREGVTGDYEDSLDSGWGNRAEIGFMLEDGHGWSSTFMKISGPNAYETIFQERIDRLNTEDLNGPGDDDGGNFDRFGQLLPSADRNLQQFSERAYQVADSINVLNATSLDINKTWRLEPYHYGGILEPMIGIRYINLKDYWQRQNYVRGVDIDDNPIETLFSDNADTDNKMIGGQLGARYFKYQSRFLLSTEFKAFALANFQSHRSVAESTTTTYDGIGIDSGTISVLVQRNGLAFRDNSEFVVGFDLRADLAYQLTRHFQLRAGVQMIDLGRGIWRGQLNDDTDQSTIMAGFTFGAALNR